MEDERIGARRLDGLFERSYVDYPVGGHELADQQE